jgi:hypothetical protein
LLGVNTPGYLIAGIHGAGLLARYVQTSARAELHAVAASVAKFFIDDHFILYHIVLSSLELT